MQINYYASELPFRIYVSNSGFNGLQGRRGVHFKKVKGVVSFVPCVTLEDRICVIDCLDIKPFENRNT